jgi:hypothetical protein
MYLRVQSVLPALCLAALQAGAASAPPLYEPVGGANAPSPTPPPPLVVTTAEMQAEGFTIRVPSGEYRAPAEGAPNYRIPGPIVAFKGPDNVWRGHGYLETYARITSFKGEVAADRATLKYVFENEGRYDVTISIRGNVAAINEECTLGQRNFYVFDAFYGWEPSSAFVTDPTGDKHAFLYLPCHYDKLEASITPSTNTSPALGAVAVLNPDRATRDVAAFIVRSPDAWRNADRMAIGLWQHRQLPGDPASRHFLGPETKSDSTPNPRTVPLIGKSLYEGHVTVEFNLGSGRRLTAFTVYPKPAVKEDLPVPLRQAIEAAAMKPEQR